MKVPGKPRKGIAAKVFEFAKRQFILESIGDRERFERILVRILACSIVPILLVNLAVNVILFTNARDRFIAQKSAELTSAAAAADEKVRNIECMASVIGRSADVMGFIVDPDGAGFDRRLRISNVLNDFVAAHDAVSSIYIYSSVADQVIASASGVFKTSGFYDVGWLPEFQRYFLGFDRMRTREVRDRNGKPLWALTIMRNLPVGSWGKTGAIVVNLKEEALLAAAAKEGKAENVSYVVDTDGYVVAHPDKRLIGSYIGGDGLFAAARTRDSGSLLTRDDAGAFAACYATGGYSHWIFVSEARMAALSASARGGLIVNFILVLIAVAALLLIGLRVSKGIYLPIEELETSNRLFENAKPMMAQNVLSNLLNDRLADEREIASALRFIGKDLPYPLFTVLVFEIDRYELLQEERGRISLGYIKKALTSILEATVPADAEGLIGEVEADRICLLLNHGPDLDETAVLETAQRIVAGVARELPIVVTCGIGRAYPKASETNRSYAEASYALQDKLLQGCGCAIVFSDLEEDASTPIDLTSDKEREFLTAVRIGREDGLDALTDELFEELRGRFARDAAGARRHLEALAAGIAETMEDGASSMGETLRAARSPDDIRTWIKRAAVEAVSANMARKQHVISAAAERIASYVDANFANNRISLIDIGDAVGLSPSYVSRVFKERFNMNYVDYLNLRRVEKAKELLSGSASSIGDVGTKAGFASLQTFARVFKKQTGMTPGSYRTTRTAAGRTSA